MLFIIELDIVSKCWVDSAFKDLSNTFDDILAVLASIDNPADVLLKGFDISLRFVKTSFTIN